MHYAQGRGLGGSSLINGGVVTGEVPPDLAGLLCLERPWAHGVVADALLAAARDASEVRLVRRNGMRVTAFDMFLGPDSPLGVASNLTIKANADVRMLLVNGRRVVGVQTAGGDEVLGDAVVLCAGAIGTPTLLLRSRIDTPGVGVGVQDHPAVRLAFDLDAQRFDPTVPAIAAGVHRGAHQVLALDHVRADLPLGVLITGLLRVESRGVVSLPDPDGPAAVSFNMLATSADLTALVTAARDLIAIARRRAFRDAVGQIYIDDHGTTMSQLRTAADIERWVQSTDLGGFHHVAASCRRGVVTDSNGWLRGYDRLAIGDASLLDGVAVTDPYIAVVAQALRLPTQGFLSRYRP